MIYKFTSVNGLPCSTNSTEKNSNMVVICLHGNSVDNRIWEPLQEMANTKMQVIAISLPGHGGHTLTGPITFDEAANMIYEAILGMKINEHEWVCLLGASLGGHLAVQIAHINHLAKRAVSIVELYIFGAPLNCMHEEFPADLPQFVPDSSKHPDIGTVLERGLLFKDDPFTDDEAKIFSACQGPPDEGWLDIMTDAAKNTSKYARSISRDLFEHPRDEVQHVIDLLRNALQFRFTTIHGRGDAAVSFPHIEAEVAFMNKKLPKAMPFNPIIIDGTHSLALTNTRDLYELIHE